MLAAYTALHAFLSTRLRDERGQSTVEYALVILGAAALALLVLAWAARTGRVGQLFNRVMDSVTDKVA